MQENICKQCHINNLARTESFWVFSPGFSSLINNISNIKQSNFDLHFLKTENCLSFKSDFDRPWSSKCLPIGECLCSPMGTQPITCTNTLASINILQLEDTWFYSLRICFVHLYSSNFFLFILTWKWRWVNVETPLLFKVFKKFLL